MQGPHSNFIFKFSVFPQIIPVPMSVICNCFICKLTWQACSAPMTNLDLFFLQISQYLSSSDWGIDHMSTQNSLCFPYVLAKFPNPCVLPARDFFFFFFFFQHYFPCAVGTLPMRHNSSGKKHLSIRPLSFLDWV